MHNSRRELLDDFLAFVGDRDDDEARTIADGCLNRALITIWQTTPWRVFRSPVPLQLTLAVNQARYALPDYFGRVGPGEVRNATRGGLVPRLREGELEQLFPWAGTDQEVAGAPARYEIAGTCGVHTQPEVTGEELYAVSDDSSDVDVVVSIAGDDENGRWTRNEVTLTGATRITLGTWSYIDEVGKAFADGSDAVTEGTSSRGQVLIAKTNDDTELQRLFPQESSKQHDILALYPKPSAADVLVVPVIRKPKRVFQSADALPDLWAPAIFEEMVLDWEVNLGELNPVTALNAPRPRLQRLLALENQTNAPRRKRPFGA